MTGMNNSITYKRHPIHTSYFIGDNGAVFSTRKNKITWLSLKPNKKGYVTVKVENKKTVKVHRLVAETFIGLSNLEVNHKNKNKEDNSLNNLEYCSRSENVLHAHKNRKRFVYKVSNDCRYCVAIYKSKKNLIRANKLFDSKEEAYEYAKELYKQHFGEYPWE